jgi:hypothetical protein
LVSKKQKRDGKDAAASGDDVDGRFHMTLRRSLKELHMCLKLLKPHHLNQLAEGGLGHLKDFSIFVKINRCFLMYKIDPVMMTLDFSDGNRKLKITVDSIELLFGLPRGTKTPPRPCDIGYLDDLMDLKAELGLPRKKQLDTKDLRWFGFESFWPHLLQQVFVPRLFC